MGPCEHGNVPLGSINGGEVFDYLSNYLGLKKSQLNLVNLSEKDTCSIPLY